MYKLFPNIVHDIEVYNFQDRKRELQQYCYDEMGNDPDGKIYRTNRGGWQSDDGYHLHDNPVRRAVLDTLGYYLNNNSIFKPNVNLYLTACWINVNGKGHFNIQHDHPACHMSGALYVKVPPIPEKFTGGGSTNVYGYSTTKIQGEGVIGGEICFSNQLAFNAWQELYNYTDEFKEKHIQFGAYYMPPKEGTMLFFPAHLRHHVEPNKSDEDRISCSFNLDLVQDRVDGGETGDSS